MKALDAALRSLRALKSWEHASSRGAMQALDWRPCRAVAQKLGYKRHPLTIHVAGSKGKGTVCALVGAALERAGFRVGVVTSPHTYHFGERLRIGMRPAGDALAPHLQRAVDLILEARRREDAVLAAATQFDAFVAAALKAAQKCDAVVVEVGLGGRRDSTNFLQAPITALVSVEREHTEVLGDSLRGIAGEKAGICTKDGVLVLGELGRAPREKALEIAQKRGATPLATRPARIIRGIPAGSLAVARGVLDAVGGFVDGGLLDDPRVLRTALKALPARAESIKGGYVDGAHTAASVAAFAKSVKRKGRGVVLIVALRADKDVEDVARAVREHLNPTRVVCCSCGEGFVAASKLAAAFDMAEVAPSPAAAFAAVPCDASYVRIALGSFELAAAARTAWT